MKLPPYQASCMKISLKDFAYLIKNQNFNKKNGRKISAILNQEKISYVGNTRHNLLKSDKLDFLERHN